MSLFARKTESENKETPRPEAMELKALLINPGEADHSELQERMEWRAIRACAGGDRVFTGIMTGMQRTSDNEEVAVVSYKEYQVLIPLDEMVLSSTQTSADRLNLRKRVGRMLGAEVEFVIRGCDDTARTLVGSRRDAMRKKAQHYFFGEQPIITEGRVVEARIVAIGHQWAKLEVFGVETNIRFMGLDWEWIAEVGDKYQVGERVLVRVTKISGGSPETLEIETDRRSVCENPDIERFEKCRLQSLYIGKVITIRDKAILIRLNIGVNAIAVGCSTDTLPGRGDTVILAVTGKDEERLIARGILTRIIRSQA